MNSQLASLSADVLAQILTGVNVLQLLKCGNTVTNSKIAGSVTHLHLEANSRFKCNFPPLIFKLRSLRHLHISSGFELAKEHSEWPSIIKSLPQSLEQLNINSDDVHYAFFNYDGGHIITTQYERGVSRYVDIGAILPRLHTLKLKGKDHVLEDFAALPNTLTHLEANATLSSMEPEHIPLPRSLLKLVGYFRCKLTTKFWSPLSNLEYYDMQFSPSSHFDAAAWLPRSLTHFSYIPSHCFFLWSQKFATTVPPHLKSLSLTHLDLKTFTTNCDWIAALPRNLTRFDYILDEETWVHGETDDLPKTLPVSSLPRTLTHMTFNYCPTTLRIADFFELKGDSVEAKRSNWPSSLTVLEMPAPVFLASDIELLPQTLTYLSYGIAQDVDKRAPKDVEVDATSFPPNLTHLALGRSGGGHVVIHNKFNLLKTLYLGTMECSSTVTQKSISTLPSSLTDMLLIQCANCAEIPRFLTCLNIIELDCLQFGLLPRTLTNLTVLSLFRFSGKLFTGSLFDGLPSSLVHLTLSTEYHPEEDYLTDLKHLTIGEDDVVYVDSGDEDVARASDDVSRTGAYDSDDGKRRKRRKMSDRLFPSQRLLHTLPHLESLDLGRVVKLDSSFARELPRGLKKANLGLTEIKPEDFKFLPTGLLSLQFTPSVHTSKLTHEDMQDWPLSAARGLDHRSEKLLEPRIRQHFH